jgi:hypothetical protein
MGLLMQRVEKNIRQNYDRGRAAREAVGSLRVSPSHARRLQKLRPISRQRVPKPGIRFDQQSGGIVGRHRPDHGEHDHVTQHSANSRKRSCARGVTPISPKPATVVTTGMRTTHSTSAMRKIQSVPFGRLLRKSTKRVLSGWSDIDMIDEFQPLRHFWLIFTAETSAFAGNGWGRIAKRTQLQRQIRERWHKFQRPVRVLCEQR